jgi:Tfp pilus assembly protein PilO
MRTLSKREKIILVVCLSVSAVFAVLQWVVKPLQESGSSVEDRLRVTQSKLDRALAMAANEEVVKQRYQQLKSIIGIASSEGAEMSSMVSTVEAAARQANVHIANMQPQRVIVKEGVLFFPVEIQVDGQWDKIAQFLYIVQQKPNFYFVDQVNLEKYSDTTGSLRGRIVVSRLRLKKKG